MRSQQVSVLFSEPKIPQSRRSCASTPAWIGFSALQRAENSSIGSRRTARRGYSAVSVLFSEPKIPQFGSSSPSTATATVSVLFSEPKIPQSMSYSSVTDIIEVSVLFSEPKIPQYAKSSAYVTQLSCFSALQRAENSSIVRLVCFSYGLLPVSVLFSEPKIPQCAKRNRSTTWY